MENPIREAISQIEIRTVEDLQTELDEKGSITSSMTLIYQVDNKTSGTKIDKVLNYDKYQEQELQGERLAIVPGIDLQTQFFNFKQRCYYRPPLLTMLIEEKRKTHTEVMDDYYDQFMSNKINDKKEATEIEIRFESYVGIFRSMYVINDGVIEFKRPLGIDGRKFLPYLN